MKKNMIKTFKKEKKNILIGIISLIALILGSIFVNFIPTLLIILFIDIIILVLTKKSKKFSVTEKLKSLLVVCFCCFIFLLVSGIIFGIYIAIASPDFTPDKLYNKEATIIYDKDGNEVAKLGTENRKTITYDQASESLIDAIIATEDSRFFQHSGVDLARFVKASASQLLGQGGGGASTITMQVVKNTFTSTTSSGVEGIVRKFTDMYMSVFKIETTYTKEEIFEFYINSNCMGGNIYGVEQASQAYFNKHASELNVAEAAMIAGLFQAPNAYNPYLHPDECEQRRKVVLSLMLRHGYITQEEYDIALKLTVSKLLVTTVDTVSNEYQAFIDTVVDEVTTRTGQDPYSVSMKIYTTLNPTMQKTVDNIMNGVTYKWKNDVVQAGSVILDVDTGAIAAVAAGHNRTAGGWNFATMNKRQIGSTAKPLYDYGPGIEYNNWSTATIFTDEPFTYSDGKKIKDFDGGYKGYIDMHEALKQSRNIPALKAFQQLDNSKIKEFVTNLGLSPEIVSGMIYETHAIGGYNGESPLTVAAAYAAFSNGGYYNEPHSFTKIIYTDSGDEYVLKPVTKRVMSEATAYMITTILEDTAGYAVGMNVNGVNYCAKTGTTDLTSAIKNEYGLSGAAISDKWIASYNSKYAVAVWYGYKELNKDNYLTGADGSFKTVFQAIAKAAYTEKSSWSMPDSVVQVEIETGLDELLLSSEYTPSNLRSTAYFKKGFEPATVSERFAQLSNVTNVAYDTSSSKLSWTKIATPKYMDDTVLNTMATKLFTDEGYRSSYLNNFKNYNNSYIGNVVYKIYTKDNSGTLTLVGTTSDNNYIVPANGNTTFVVKTSYSALTNNVSTGAEFTTKGSSSIITSALNGLSSVTVESSDSYNDLGVKVTKDGIDVTSAATITISVKDKNSVIYSNTAAISTAGTYTITYTISYQGYTNTLTRTVTKE